MGISFSRGLFSGAFAVSFGKGSSYEIQASAQTEMDTSRIYEMNFIEILWATLFNWGNMTNLHRVGWNTRNAYDNYSLVQDLAYSIWKHGLGS